MKLNKDKAMKEYLNSDLSMKESAKKHNIKPYSLYLHIIKVSLFEGFSIIRLN